MYQLAPNIELLFTEAGESPRPRAGSGRCRLRRRRDVGADRRRCPATPKDIPALKAALEETGVHADRAAAEPRTQFMIPPRDHSAFYRELDEGVEIAHELGCPAHRRRQRHGLRRQEAPDQLDELIEILPQGDRADRGLGGHARAGARQHPRRPPGCPPRPHRRGGLRRPRRRLAVLRHPLRPLPLGGRGRGCRQPSSPTPATCQVRADRRRPGRGEPGTGAIDWPARARRLRASGYDGPIGLEYYPTHASAESVAAHPGTGRDGMSRTDTRLPSTSSSSAADPPARRTRGSSVRRRQARRSRCSRSARPCRTRPART